MPARRRASTVAAAVDRDLREIAKRDKGLADSALAASARALAAELDDSGNSATSKSMCARVLIDTLDRLRGLMPEAPEKDKLDELGKRRDARIARRAKA